MPTSLTGRLLAAAALVAVIAGSGGAAYADDVVNTIDGSVDTAAELMPLTLGGPVGTTTVVVQAVNNDGQNNCNLNGQRTATFRVTSSHPNVASVSPSELTFANCDAPATLTVTSHLAGDASITLLETDNGTKGTFNLAPATFRVEVVEPPNGAPTVSVNGVDASSYELGVDTLPTPGCSSTDPEDGASSPAPDIVNSRDAFGLGVVEVTCSYTDAGGLTATSSLSYAVVDTIAPVIVLDSVTPAANANGWNKSPVTAAWVCSDAGSGVQATKVTATTVGEGSALALTGTCADNAGHSASDTVDDLRVDLTDPVVTIGRSPAANGAGWNNGDVTVTWTCTDPLSGVTDAGGSRVLGEGADQSVTGTCTDRAGNSASAEVTGVKVDTTAPVITLQSRTAPYDDRGWNGGDVTVTWTCTDYGSGPAQSSVSRVVSTPGADQTVGATCRDLAGNTASNTVGGINIDTTSPSINMWRDPATANANGWNDSPVEVTWTCTDTGGAGVVGEGGSQVVGEGAGQSVPRTCTDHAGNTATDAVNDINVDLTDPVIVIGRTPAADGWSNTDVTVAWTCTDTLSGVTGAGDSKVLGEGADQSAEGTCTDKAGNTATAEVTDIDVDLTDPVVTIGRSPAANAAGWSNTDVTVAWTCTDTLSGVTGAGDSKVLGEGADQSAEGTCTDKAGNTATAKVIDIDVDTTDPVINIGRSPAANSAGWNRTDVTVSWTCTDALSGATNTGDSTVLGQGADQSAPGTCTDLAGNTATAEVTGVNVDKTAPVVSWVNPIADGSSYYFGSVLSAPTCSATDLLSGLDGPCTVGGYAATVGIHTLTAGATDLAGNASELSSSYTVMAWTLNGYYKPVDNGNVWNLVKNGSTVPLKFEAFIGSAEITDVATLDAEFTVKGVACPGAGAATDDVELTTTGGTMFRYDASGGQFIQNWQTPKKAAACYQVITTTADGSSLSALFKLK